MKWKRKSKVKNLNNERKRRVQNIQIQKNQVKRLKRMKMMDRKHMFLVRKGVLKLGT